MLQEGLGVWQRGLEVGQELELIAERVSRLVVATFDPVARASAWTGVRSGFAAVHAA